MIRKRLVKQFTVDELKGMENEEFLKHGKRKRQLSNPVFNGIKNNQTALFQVKSSEYQENNKKYDVYLMFPDFKEEKLQKGLSAKEIVDLVIDEGNVKVACTCPAFLYWGYMYIDTVLDSKYGMGENRKPVERNPEEKGVFCKHLGRTFDWILANDKSVLKKEFLPVIEGVLKSNEKRERNKAELEEKEQAKKMADEGLVVEEVIEEIDEEIEE